MLSYINRKYTQNAVFGISREFGMMYPNFNTLTSCFPWNILTAVRFNTRVPSSQNPLAFKHYNPTEEDGW